MLDLTINTYWNVETLYYVFNAVAALMAGSTFAGILKLIFVFGIGIGMFAYIGGKQLELATWFFQALIFVTVLNLPIARVTLTDKTNLQPPRVVANVPFAMAVVGQTVNMTFGAMTSAYETAFGVPDELGLAQGDVGFGHKILKQINNVEVRDPGLRADLMQFIKECTIYDIKDGEISAQDVIGSASVFNTILSNTSPARFVTYNTLTASPTTATCKDAGMYLKAKVDQAVIAAQTYYGRQAFPLASSDALAQNLFMNAVGTANNWILQSTQGVSDSLKQSMFNNIWRQAGTSLPAMLNDPSQVAEVSALAGQAQAAAQANASNSILSLMGQETLPHMRNWMEAILYAMFPFVVILMVVASVDGAKKVLGGYMMALAWIGLWPVLFAVINHLSMMYLKHKTDALALSQGVPFQLSDVFDATLVNEQAMIGYMVVLVPFIAAGIIKMAEGGIMGVADRAISGASSAGSAAGAAWGAGNVSMGNVSMDGKNVNTTSMNKHDASTSMAYSGEARMQDSSGGWATMSGNGVAGYEQAMNRFAHSMNVDERLDSQRSQEAHNTQISGSGTAVSNRHADASTGSVVTGRDATRSTNQNVNDEAHTGQNGTIAASHDKGQVLHTAHAVNSSFRSSAGASDRFDGSLQAGAGGRGGGGGGYDQREEDKIRKTMQGQGSSHEQIDKALANYRAKNGGGKGAGSSGRFGASVVMNTAKTYEATHSRDKSVNQSHLDDESGRNSENYARTGGTAHREGTGEQSSQTNRLARDANRSNVDEHSRVDDAVNRNESGIGDRANRSETNSFGKHRDLLQDRNLMNQVAHRFGMSSMRFYSQEAPAILAQAQQYAEEKGFVQQASKLNNTTFDGGKLATSSVELDQQTQANRAEVPNKVDSLHVGKVAATGYTDVDPVKVNTVAPSIVEEARIKTSGALDPKNPESIPVKSGALVENVNAWASPDKDVGAGRANPQAVVEQTEINDAKDTALKIWDRAKGGDGMADGERLNDNKRRDSLMGASQQDRSNDALSNSNQFSGGEVQFNPTDSTFAPYADQEKK